MKNLYENFENVFDSSLIDYSGDTQQSDERYLKENLILNWLKDNNVDQLDDILDIRDVYSINSDFSIDVHGDFALEASEEDELPEFIQFNNIFGNFCIDGCGLRSFRGLPIYVEGDCDLCNNYAGDNDEIDNLQYLPKRIEGYLDLSNNGYCDRCNCDWQFYTNAEIEENYYDNLFMLNTIKNNIEQCEGDIKLGEDEYMPCAKVNLYNIDENIADLQDDINNKIWLKWMVEDDSYKEDDEWDEECTKWVEEHWPELKFEGKHEDNEDNLDESFNNIFDSSLIDYHEDFEKQDEDYLETLKKERGYISDDEYQKVLNVFKDFVIPEETFLKHTKKPISNNNSLSMINLTLSREKFENATGIKRSSVFYKKEDLLHIDNKWYSKQQVYGNTNYPSIKQYHPEKGSIWDNVKKGLMNYTGDSVGTLIYDKITFQLNRSKSFRPYWQIRTLKHLADGKHLDINNRGTHISHTRNMDSYGYGYYDLDDIINIILKRLYRVLNFSGYGYPTAHMTTY